MADWLVNLTEWIYEAARLEAAWAKCPIVPEPWDQRDEAFRRQMTDYVNRLLSTEPMPTPEEAHQSWMEAYFKMAWIAGPAYDAITKTHPDLVPFMELPMAERKKDEIFLLLVQTVKQIRVIRERTP